MKKIKLDPQEQIVNKDFDNNKYVSVKNVKNQKKALAKLAKANLKKTKNINIRISEPVLLKLKSRALESGIPYQTLISTILYQYADNKFRISV